MGQPIDLAQFAAPKNLTCAGCGEPLPDLWVQVKEMGDGCDPSHVKDYCGTPCLAMDMVLLTQEVAAQFAAEAGQNIEWN